MISFIHLSDIHFRRYSGDRYDVDEDLRNELEQDIKSTFLAQKQSVKGILVCGDIAFSGKEEEYVVASAFLNRLCEILGLEKSSVFCVPGNHDIDQDVPRNEIAVKLLQDQLARQENTTAFDAQLASVFRSQNSSKLLYLPLENYNTKFAGQYDCNLAPDAFDWKHYIPISERYKLCLVGLNSTIISNADDHAGETERLMRMGQMQVPQRQEGVIYLTLCHHPPECWNDPEGALKEKLNKRVGIQLYGHKHLQTINQTERSLIIGSGATHPSRWEPNWIPRYNWISLDISVKDGHDYLNVKVYPRILEANSGQFIHDKTIGADKEYAEFDIKICWNNEEMKEQPPLGNVCDKQNSTYSEFSDWKRPFVYAFMNLSYFQRKEILRRCGLDKPEDEGRKHVEMLNDIIERAEEHHCVERLIAETEQI